MSFLRIAHTLEIGTKSRKNVFNYIKEIIIVRRSTLKSFLIVGGGTDPDAVCNLCLILKIIL